jgi:hypothetical protein
MLGGSASYAVSSLRAVNPYVVSILEGHGKEGAWVAPHFPRGESAAAVQGPAALSGISAFAYQVWWGQESWVSAQQVWSRNPWQKVVYKKVLLGLGTALYSTGNDLGFMLPLPTLLFLFLFFAKKQALEKQAWRKKNLLLFFF